MSDNLENQNSTVVVTDITNKNEDEYTEINTTEYKVSTKQENVNKMKIELAAQSVNFLGQALNMLDNAINTDEGQSIIKGINNITSNLRTDEPTEDEKEDPLQPFKTLIHRKQITSENPENKVQEQIIYKNSEVKVENPGIKNEQKIPGSSNNPEAKKKFESPKNIKNINDFLRYVLKVLLAVLFTLYNNKVKPAFGLGIINFISDLIYHTFMLWFITAFIYTPFKK